MISKELKKQLEALETPLDRIKFITNNFPLPKYQGANTLVHLNWEAKSEKQEIDERKAFFIACDFQDSIIEYLSWNFTQYEHHNEFWNVKESELDYSLNSLKLIDSKQNNNIKSLQGTFKKNFVKEWIIPELYCYVMATIIKNIPEIKYQRLYNNNPLKMSFKSRGRKATIEPYKYIESCVFGGFLISELPKTLEKVSEEAIISKSYFHRNKP